MRALLLCLAVLVAGCTAPEGPPANSTADGPSTTVDLAERFVHEHAAFSLWLAGERLSFNHTAYDLQSVRNITAHLHIANTGGEHAIHVEGNFRGGKHDVTLGTFLRIHGLEAAPGRLTLDSRDGHNGTTWNDTAALRWQVWARPANGTWTQAPEGPALLLRDGLRVLLTYAPPGADLDAQFRSVPSLDARGLVVGTGEA